MKHNDIVVPKTADGFFIPYGRIWKRTKEGKFLVINCFKDVTEYERHRTEFERFWNDDE